MKIRFQAGTASFEAELNDSPAAKTISEHLPIDSTVSTWGDEIYFPIGLDCRQGETTMELDAGDLGYWPQGKCLCVFFGPTPASGGDRPVPASPVIRVGTTGAGRELLRSIGAGGKISVSRAE